MYVGISNSGEFQRGRQFFRRDRLSHVHGVTAHAALRGDRLRVANHQTDRDQGKGSHLSR